MADKEVTAPSVSIQTFEPGKKTPAGFQSPEAARKSQAQADGWGRGERRNNGEIPEAEIAAVEAPAHPGVAVKAEDMNRRVAITPRVNIPRTRIGGIDFSFTAGKKVSVPRHVAVLLEEKGIL